MTLDTILIKHSELPSYLLQHLQRGRMDRTLSIVVPAHTTASGKNILIYGTECWNRLTVPARRSPTMTAFKAALDAEHTRQ